MVKRRSFNLKVMNDQPSKKIQFNKSTLFNLKAELLKKQEEVFEKKQLPQNKVENFKPPPPQKSDNDKTEKVLKKSFKDALKQVDVEELEACRKSKAILEKKAELYNHLADGVGSSELAGRFLVDFQTKKQDEVREAVLAAREDDDIHKVDADDDEWTEFTDCLGRTRKCHKTDIELFRKKDLELKKATLNVQDVESIEPTIQQEEKKDTPLLVQKTNDYLRSLREKWEEKEKELLGKDRDIHYQDLLFDEARMHGVGYYAFSTDDKERRQQMDELLKLRQETLQAQKETEEVRKKREGVIAARVKAARARQRARAGLPPEDPEEEDRETFTTHLLQFLNKQRDESEARVQAEEMKRKKEEEKEKQKQRESYVREWDLGKAGIEDKVKKFREMTQEEYVEQQRSKRVDEFAPVQTSSSSKSNYTFDDSGSMVGMNGGPAKTWSDVRPKATYPIPIHQLPETSDVDPQKGLYFSSKQQYHDNKAPSSSSFVKIIPRPPPPPIISDVITKRDVKYKNFVKADEPTPIVNELSDDDDKNDVAVRVTDKRSRDGTEIAPPPTYDYYGPIPKRAKHQNPFDSDIHEAFDQGKKSLEAKSSNRQISKDYDFTFG